MTTQTARETRSNTPSYDDLLRTTNSVLPLVEAEADEAERLYHQTDKLVAEFRRNGLYRIMIPKALGGYEMPWVEGMDLIERVSRADGSAGWCMMVEGVMGASIGSFIPDQGARTVYPNGADVTAAGNGVPRGFARPVDGGYMIKGHWAYGSAITHAEWIHSGCFVMDGDKMKMTADGHPEIVLCHHPKASITLKGNWDSLGLRGTGSYDYVQNGEELFVPKYMTYPFDGAQLARGGIQYSPGLPVSTTWGHTAWALGVGRRALDELRKLANARADVFGKLTDSASFKQGFAQAEAKYRSARAFVYGSWDDLCETFAKDQPPTVEQIALIRLAMRHLHDVISEISTYGHKVSRGVSLRPSHLQRAYRDIHSGTQHVLLADEIVQECGKVLLGAVGKDAQWQMFGVKESGSAGKPAH